MLILLRFWRSRAVSRGVRDPLLTPPPLSFDSAIDSLRRHGSLGGGTRMLAAMGSIFSSQTRRKLAVRRDARLALRNRLDTGARLDQLTQSI